MNPLDIIRELKQILADHLGDLIREIIFFGSRNDGKPREYSDYDILIVLKGEYDWHLENAILSLCNEINLKHDIILDVQIISEKEFGTLRAKQPFIQNALAQGAAV